MAFNAMMSGAECAVDANPLSQMLKHTERESPFQRVLGDFLTDSHILTDASHRIVSEEHPLDRQAVKTLKIHGPAHFAAGPSQADFEAAFNASKGRMGTPADLMAMSNMKIRSSTDPSVWLQEWDEGKAEGQHIASMSSPLSPMAMNFRHPGLSTGFYMPPMMQSPGIADEKGKAKAQDAEFEAAFARFEEITQESKAKDADSTGTTNGRAELQAKREAEQAEILGQDDQESDYAAIMRELGKEAMAAEAVEAEAEYAEAMKQMWEEGLGDYGGPDAGFANIGDGGVIFDGNGVPALEQYRFDEKNPHLEEQGDPRSFLDDAKAILAHPSGTGSLREAGLLLEAAIQSWVLLGEVRGMDEREAEGLIALREGVNRGAQQALLSLAISYTNESYNRAAQHTLRQYLHTRFPDIVGPKDVQPESLAPWAGHELTTDLFYDGLGTLYYANGEYDKAVDCFASALSIRPKDYLLWNRYGSCLSNSNRPAEALDAYREALQLRPGYTRAIYNVGVACMNIDAYHEAAEHFLGALVVQGAGPGGSGTNDNDPLWSTLQRTFVLMDRTDLAEIARGGRNVEDFRSRGFNF
ncbi:Tetratricopeptide repeat [Rhizoctonia solani]|uniref:Tetratricopeptide repeat n=1 Tax=Rhizoctonia solani TaxID=456999 RepID=A0A8H7M5R9_9AGAM|nr:Tetratricopeptide repeat [Rhizoctonia solani]